MLIFQASKWEKNEYSFQIIKKNTSYFMTRKDQKLKNTMKLNLALLAHMFSESIKTTPPQMDTQWVNNPMRFFSSYKIK